MRIGLAVLMCAFATVTLAAEEKSAPDAAAVATAAKGQMLVAVDGARIGPVYRVTPDGGAQVMLDGKLITVPASSLSTVSGKLTTSLSKSAILAIH
jgi:hypothetical protein